jgi:hypothetical protein
LEGRHVVIHSPIGRGPPVNNSPGRTAISAVVIEEQGAIVAELVVAMVIAAMPGTEGGPPLGAEALLESGHQVEMQLARPIDLATREIAVVPIGLAVAT